MKTQLRSIFASTFGVVALAQFAAPAGAVNLLSENFGDPASYSLGLNGGAPVGSKFTVTNGNVDLIGSGGIYDYYPGNGKFVDLNGDTQGTIASTAIFTFNPGDTGTLSFDYGIKEGASNSANVFLGETLLGTVTAPPVGFGATIAGAGGAFTNQVFNITSPTSGALSFVSVGGGFDGVVIDNIQLTSSAAATSVPEPAEFPGMLLFAGGALMLRRQLRARAAKNNTVAS